MLRVRAAKVEGERPRRLGVLLRHGSQAPPAGGQLPASPGGHKRPVLLLLLADLRPGAVVAAARCEPAALQQGAAAIVLLHPRRRRLLGWLGTPRLLPELLVRGRLLQRHHWGRYRRLHGRGGPRLEQVPILCAPAHSCKLGANELNARLHDATAMALQPGCQRSRCGAALCASEAWGAARLPSPG